MIYCKVSFDWFRGNGIWAHTPWTTNIFGVRNDCFLFWGISLGVFNKKYSTRACWIWDRGHAPRWLSTIPYPTRARGIIVKYTYIWGRVILKENLRFKNICVFSGWDIVTEILRYFVHSSGGGTFVYHTNVDHTYTALPWIPQIGQIVTGLYEEK